MKSHCPTNYALEHFGDRWTLLIVPDTFFKGFTHYADFLKCEESISTNVLATRLKAMEQTGLIRADSDPDRRRIRYVLTDKGRDLGRLMLEINRWAGRHDPETQAPREHLEQIEDDFEGLLRSFKPPR